MRPLRACVSAVVFPVIVLGFLRPEIETYYNGEDRQELLRAYIAHNGQISKDQRQDKRNDRLDCEKIPEVHIIPPF